MEKEYDVGIDTNKIFFKVIIGTVGVATTLVVLVLPKLDPKTLIKSNANNGNIPNTLIGNAHEIRKGFLQVGTTIDFGILPEADRQAAISTLVITYRLTGGTNGEIDFHDDTDDRKISDEGKLVAVEKTIRFV